MQLAGRGWLARAARGGAAGADDGAARLRAQAARGAPARGVAAAAGRHPRLPPPRAAQLARGGLPSHRARTQAHKVALLLAAGHPAASATQSLAQGRPLGQKSTPSPLGRRRADGWLRRRRAGACPTSSTPLRCFPCRREDLARQQQQRTPASHGDAQWAPIVPPTAPGDGAPLAADDLDGMQALPTLHLHLHCTCTARALPTHCPCTAHALAAHVLPVTSTSTGRRRWSTSLRCASVATCGWPRCGGCSARLARWRCGWATAGPS